MRLNNIIHHTFMLIIKIRFVPLESRMVKFSKEICLNDRSDLFKLGLKYEEMNLKLIGHYVKTAKNHSQLNL